MGNRLHLGGPQARDELAQFVDVTSTIGENLRPLPAARVSSSRSACRSNPDGTRQRAVLTWPTSTWPTTAPGKGGKYRLATTTISKGRVITHNGTLLVTRRHANGCRADSTPTSSNDRPCHVLVGRRSGERLHDPVGQHEASAAVTLNRLSRLKCEDLAYDRGVPRCYRGLPSGRHRELLVFTGAGRAFSSCNDLVDGWVLVPGR